MTYKWSIRLLISSSIAVGMGLLSYANSFLERSGHSNWIYLIAFLIVFLIWEINNHIHRILEKRFSGSSNKKILYQILISFFLTFLIINTLYAIFKLYSIANWEREGSTYSFSIFVLVNTAYFLIFMLVTGLYFGVALFDKYKSSELKAEKFEKESTQANLEVLRNQVNPHFLFNNMSILAALIDVDSNLAKTFLHEFSEVYRYVLLSKNKELVQLKEELDFLDSYLFLLKKRYANNLDLSISCNGAEEYFIPPCALQLLIENAFKHNVVSAKKPLTIKIYIEGESIIVENNLQKKHTVEPGTGTGLINIHKRYSYFTSEKIEVLENHEAFKVKLPLLMLETAPLKQY